MATAKKVRKAKAGNGGDFHVGQELWDGDGNNVVVTEINTDRQEATLKGLNEPHKGEIITVPFSFLHSVSDGADPHYTGMVDPEILAEIVEEMSEGLRDNPEARDEVKVGEAE